MIYFIKNQRSQKHIKSSAFKVILIQNNNLLYKLFLSFNKIISRQNRRKKEKIRRKQNVKKQIKNRIKLDNHKQYVTRHKVIQKNNKKQKTQKTKTIIFHNKSILNIIILTKSHKNQVKLQMIILKIQSYSHQMNTKNKSK